jgi:hypothetical protein
MPSAQHPTFNAQRPTSKGASEGRMPVATRRIHTWAGVIDIQVDWALKPAVWRWHVVTELRRVRLQAAARRVA